MSGNGLKIRLEIIFSDLNLTLGLLMNLVLLHIFDVKCEMVRINLELRDHLAGALCLFWSEWVSERTMFIASVVCTVFHALIVLYWVEEIPHVSKHYLFLPWSHCDLSCRCLLYDYCRKPSVVHLGVFDADRSWGANTQLLRLPLHCA